MSEWLPIESAPKDAEVLLYFPAKVTGAYKEVKMRAMYQVGYVGSFPHRLPTHWKRLEPPK
jgi:hypothetical protein